MTGKQATLIVAATFEELATFGLEDAVSVEPNRLWKISSGPSVPSELFAAVLGVGVPHTLLRLIPLLDRLRPDLVVNFGIAGAYPRCEVPGVGGVETKPDCSIGEVLVGQSEVFADLGMEIPDEERFRPLGAFPFADESLRAPIPLHVPDWARAAGLKQGRGATVNTCTGTLATGALRRRVLDADFESMEGAAVALACLEHGIPCTEVRAISNRAARRDMRPDNIRLAFAALTEFWNTHRHHLVDA